ncbi:MAG TPA: Fic family protein, partial [Thermoanaerobaculia bacterium]|nr:Fic family protein [Thermoanaerobaculia bacterium]
VNPYLTAARAVQVLGVSDPTARQAIGLLQGEGLLEEVSGRSWRRIYLSRPILEVIEERV